MQNWYAVQCKAKEDARAEEHLNNQGFHVFRPMLRQRRRRGGRMVTVTESLFPRYLFIELDDSTENWAPIRSTRGVLGLVRFGAYPAPVPSCVIETLTGQLDPETGCIDLTQTTDYKPDEPVHITQGPFAGYHGLFQARNGEERVIVLLDVMQQSQRITLPEEAISRS
ncbi:transcription/translation regulatory transformer protein RfaH [Aquisalimonas asiatica]|uniref:Transcriptional antiterminator RfaH n=1 Tax=Aquisalimonas asiatica TaxID=406100 RepID=A0A1H8SQ22_9GAMM|nr:transcription/translation regulatory transformer protein RfaH [Aquisalimonas asiatica]SEO80677.1 transcriptional antiterminator RfaH [Aquisalimonas asiatica]